MMTHLTMFLKRVGGLTLSLAILIGFGLTSTASAAFGDQLYRLVAQDAAADDQLGFSVGISGNIAIAGAFLDDDGNLSDAGSAYLFDLTSGAQLFKLKASDATANANFGYDVAIDGNVAIVGARFDDDGGYQRGSAYLYNVTTGTQLFKLHPLNPTDQERIGRSVDISGNIAIVSGHGNDRGGLGNAGAAYLFDVATGQQLFKLTASDAGVGDSFGIDVAIDGNIAIVGAYSADHGGLTDAGSAYLFDVTTGQQLLKLTASDASAGDVFGISVNILGNLAIVGANRNDDLGLESGSFYLFDATTGQELFNMTASDLGANDLFGHSVALSGNFAIVGSRLHDEVSLPNTGSAYLFNVITGQQLFKFNPQDLGANDEFGQYVDIEGNYAIVGSRFHDDPVGGSNSGSVYVFDLTSASEDEPPVITCSDNVSEPCSDASGATVNFDVTATDDNDPNPIVVCTPASGSVFPIGETIVNCTATDVSGNVDSCSFTVTVTEGFGSIAGTLSAACAASGITVDAFNGDGLLVGFGVTDGLGAYSIDSLPSGQAYTVSFVAPLGYSASPNENQVNVYCNETAQSNFNLDCPATGAGDQRTIGYWKHQVGVATGGKGHAQVDAATLCGYLDLIADHFNSNAINQVIVYVPPTSNDCADKAEVAKLLLNLQGKQTMTARAKQQLTALLMNVAAGYIAQTAVISADGATVSQAITYCDNLIDDPAGDHELAKTIADEINNGNVVGAGLIPLSTTNIAYKLIPGEFALGQNYPNPFNPSTEIMFMLPVASDVKLEVYNVIGQRVSVLVSSFLEAGQHTISWDGSNVASGVYLYRLQAGGEVTTRKMMLLK